MKYRVVCIRRKKLSFKSKQFDNKKLAINCADTKAFEHTNGVVFEVIDDEKIKLLEVNDETK